MKNKFISFLVAASMVMSMGVAANADISYGTDNGKFDVDMEEVGLEFNENLVLVDEDGDVVDKSLEDAVFQPGYSLYMPLYGNSVREVENTVGHLDAEENVSFSMNSEETSTSRGDWKVEGVTDNGNPVFYQGMENVLTNDAGETLNTVNYNGNVRPYTVISSNAETKEIVITFPEVAGETEIVVEESFGPYTGEIGKSWSINFVEKSENYVENASFYRANYKDKGLVDGAWYIKVELKDEFDSVNEDEVYFRVYIADNEHKVATEKVYVKGTYTNEVVKPIDFEWTNQVNSSAAVYEVADGENGTAVFDFVDKAFYTVKMYAKEKVYLNLDTTHNTTFVKNHPEAEVSAFFNFKGTNSNFSRTGELLLACDEKDMQVYQLDSKGNYTPVDATYVEDYMVVHTGEKVDGYLFKTKELGNYVIASNLDEIVENGEVEETNPTTPTNPDVSETPVENPNVGGADYSKPNPNTGAEDFVGVAVAIGMVSVFSAAALALKKDK